MPPHLVVSRGFCGSDSGPYAQAACTGPCAISQPENSANSTLLTYARKYSLEAIFLPLLKLFSVLGDGLRRVYQHGRHRVWQQVTFHSSIRSPGLLHMNSACPQHLQHQPASPEKVPGCPLLQLPCVSSPCFPQVSAYSGKCHRLHCPALGHG